MVRLDLLVYFTVSCSLVSGQSLFYGLKGFKVNLKPQVTSRPNEILWRHNDNKVIEFEGEQEQVYGLFKNRVNLDRVSAELNISDLRYEDSGEYEVETYTNKGFDRKKYKLEVIDKVAKPIILCQRDNGSSSTTHGNQATLSCSAESRQLQHLQYEWISHGTVHSGQKLTITLSDDEQYSCRVSNPLTSETTKFTAKDCNPDKSSSKALIAGLISAVILVIVVVAAILWWKGKQKAGFTKRNTDDVEKQSQPDTTQVSGPNNSRENYPLLHLKDEDEDSYPKPDLNKKAGSETKTTSPLGRKTSSPEGLNNVPISNKDNADADQHKEPDSSAPEKTPEPEPDPAGLDNKADSDTRTTSHPLGRKPSYSEGLNNVPGSNKDDADADQHKEPDSSPS